MNRILYLLIALFVVVLIWSGIEPYDLCALTGAIFAILLLAKTQDKQIAKIEAKN